jgi:phage baseplate assembly protein V
MLGRGIIKAIDDSGGLQKLQVSFLKNETTNGLERMQEYGFTSWPLPEAEVMAGFIAGNRDHGIIIAVDDRRYSFKVDAQGNVCIYTELDKGHGTGHRIYLKRNRDIEMRCNTYDKKADTDETKNITGNKTKTVGINDSETISGNQTSQINGNFTKTINGNMAVTGLGTITITITGSGLAKIVAGGSLQADVTGNLDANVTGTAKVNSANVQLGSGTLKAVAVQGTTTDIQGSGSHSHTLTGNFSANVQAS